ncbi:hypothetical protein Hanom_Chr05g00458371 [Helianthus anomalus]
MRSIRKSMDRGGGGPGRSSGKTSGKSRTTGTSLKLFPLHFSSTTWAKKAKYCLRKYLFACVQDINFSPFEGRSP